MGKYFTTMENLKLKKRKNQIKFNRKKYEKIKKTIYFDVNYGDG